MDRIVEIRPIPAKNKQFPRKYANTTHKFRPELHRYSGRIVTGLEDLEQDELQWIAKGMGLSVENLQPESSFWTEYSLTLSDKAKSLDLSKPKDRLDYHFAMACSFIAKNQSEIAANGLRVYVMHDQRLESEKRVSAKRLLVDAYKHIDKLKSLEAKRNALKLITSSSTSGVDEQVILDRLYASAERDPKKFLATLNDEDNNYRLIILDALHGGTFQKKGVAIYDGSERVGSNMSEALLELRNNQDYYIGLKARLGQK